MKNTLLILGLLLCLSTACEKKSKAEQLMDDATEKVEKASEDVKETGEEASKDAEKGGKSLKKKVKNLF